MLTPFHRAIGIAAVACIGVGCSSEHYTMLEGEHMELRIHSITSSKRTVEIDGSRVVATDSEYEVLRDIQGAQHRAESCDVFVTLANYSDRSFLLSDSDLRAVLVNCTEWNDSEGGQWKIVDTVRHGHPDNRSFTIPTVARGERSWVYVVGLSRLVQVDVGKGDVSHPPVGWIEYRIQPDTMVFARPILGAELGAAAEVSIVGAGRCRVAPDGPSP